MSKLVHIPKDKDGFVRLMPLYDFRKPEQQEDWIKPHKQRWNEVYDEPENDA